LVTRNGNVSNLSSVIMREIYRTFCIQMKTIPVYLPRVNLVNRQHGIMKSIMRELIVDQPRQWHRYLDALMFAIRTTPFDEPSRPEESVDVEQTNKFGISAAIMGLVEDSDVKDDNEDEKHEGIRFGEESGHINIANVEETETWKDVKINP